VEWIYHTEAIEVICVGNTKLRKQERIRKDGKQRIERNGIVIDREKEPRVRVKGAIP
jgi:hypothetical protein